MIGGTVHCNGEMQQQMRPIFVKKSFDMIPAAQVAAGAPRHGDVRATALLQFANRHSGQESDAVSDRDPPAVQHSHGGTGIREGAHSPPRIAVRHLALRAQVIDFVRRDAIKQFGQAGSLG